MAFRPRSVLERRPDVAPYSWREPVQVLVTVLMVIVLMAAVLVVSGYGAVEPGDREIVIVTEDAPVGIEIGPGRSF